MAMLVWMALIVRAQNDKRELILEPLRSVKVVLNTYNTFDMFKQIADNIIVFIPLGMLLPAAAGKEPSSKSFWFTICAGLLVSLIIETLQYAFSLGYSEVDDLIFNTLGTMIGAGIFALSGKAEYKNGALTLKKGWLVYILPAVLVTTAMFALWIYREYYLYKH
ncbi:MAG: VanZ family protein [Clostridia bacterium]|nr:VanZ family protein [Clostridia bacterium]